MQTISEVEQVSGRIVVGVDGSASSLAALRWAVQEATLRSSDVVIIYAWAPPWPGDESMAALVERGSGLGEAEAMLRRALADVEPLAGAAVQSTVEVVKGASIAEALVGRAEDADLLVIGSRGRSALGAMALGSVSIACLHRATCPVVVVRS